jgi:hypothetical protein
VLLGAAASSDGVLLGAAASSDGVSLGGHLMEYRWAEVQRHLMDCCWALPRHLMEYRWVEVPHCQFFIGSDVYD